MLETPADTPWIWIGLTLASAVMLGVVMGIPNAAPNADRVATAVENVAASEHPGGATVELRAAEIRIAPTALELRGSGGRSHAPIRYGPVTPVHPDSTLARVLEGHAPERLYQSPTSFSEALAAAQADSPTWQPTGEQLQIRQVQYGEVNGVLIGA